MYTLRSALPCAAAGRVIHPSGEAMQKNVATSACTLQDDPARQDRFMLAALALADNGFSVFPMHRPLGPDAGCSCNKPSCSAIGKHPVIRGGFNASSLDPKKIRAWWGKHPQANIGIATGRVSNLLVIDVDFGNGGDASFDALLENAGQLWPETLSATTGNGVHYYFRLPDAEVQSSAGLLGRGIDVRAERGCVVAPPSLHRCGRSYAFVEAGQPILRAPDWLMSRIQGSSPCDLALTHGAAHVPLGSRNDELTRYAGKLRATGHDWERIYELLLDHNDVNCSPPLAHSEVLAISRSVAKYPKGDVSIPERQVGRGAENPLWWFKLSTRHWNASTEVALMSAEELGWYMRLKVRAFSNNGMLPADIQSLSRLAGAATREQFETSVGLVLAEFEQRTVGGMSVLVHPGLEAEIAEKVAQYDKNKYAGMMSQLKRAESRGGGSS